MSPNDAHNSWLRRLDPRLGPVAPPALDGATILRDDDALHALTRRVTVPDDEPYALFVPAVQETLVVRSAAPLPVERWRELLDDWLAALDGHGTPLVRLADADANAARALLSAGFLPTTTTALRLLDDGPTVADDGLRDAVPEDRERLLDLLELMHACDVAAGCGVARDSDRVALAHYLDEALVHPDILCLVADDGSGPDGLITIAARETAEWAAASTSLHPVAYLGLASVDPSARRRGIMRRLTAQALAWARARGAEAAVLDHASRSACARGCWTALGFRPLWHVWHHGPGQQRPGGATGDAGGDPLERPLPAPGDE